MSNEPVATKRLVKGMSAVREYFGNVTLDELKKLTPKDREDLFEPCAKAIGAELDKS